MATTSERGYGTAWQRLRDDALNLYGAWCYLCSQPIDLTAPARHPLSYSLDHLDPVSHVGTNLPPLDRVRPVHYGCNSARGNKHPRTNRGTNGGVQQPPPDRPPTSREW